MSDEPTKTAAELYIRRLHEEPHGREADLAVLALERALVRDGYVFQYRFPDDDFFDVEVDASDTVHPSAVVSTSARGVEAACRHVLDWIVASCLNEEAWLKRLDHEGRPVKLTKIGSLARAVAEADKSMRRFAASAAAASGVVSGGESVHAELDDGWRLVRLLTPAALDRESGSMQHCIGQGAYDHHLADDGKLFLSLRDPAGKPHVTMELTVQPSGKTWLEQFQGKQNQPPILRHSDRVRSWMRGNVQSESLCGEHTRWSGLALDSEDAVVDFDAPPASVRMRTDVHFVLSEGDVLPADVLRSHGDVRISTAPDRTSPVVLPDYLGSHGYLRLEGPGTFVFGKKVRATTLVASDCTLAGLPADTTVEDLDLRRCSIDVVPGRIQADRIKLKETSARLGEGLVADQIDIEGPSVCELHPSSRVDVLHVKNGGLAEIPDGCSIEMLLVVGPGLGRIGRIEGLKDLTLSNVSSDLAMPREMEVLGNMSVIGPGFPATLPERLRVENQMHVWRLQGLELPAELTIGDLSLHDGCVDVLPSGTRIEGTLVLTGSRGIEVGEGCSIREILATDTSSTDDGKDRTKVVLFDPAISRIEADGSVELRAQAPSMG